jgi:hypothetical protein
MHSSGGITVRNFFTGIWSSCSVQVSDIVCSHVHCCRLTLQLLYGSVVNRVCDAFSGMMGQAVYEVVIR